MYQTMQRDILSSIKQLILCFEQFRSMKITSKSLFDGYIFMKLLERIDHHHFNSQELTNINNKPQSNNNTKYQFPQDYNSTNENNKQLQKSLLQTNNDLFLLSTPIKSTDKQTNYLTKLKNWKFLIKSIKIFVNKQWDKGIKYDDIDLIQLSKHDSPQQIIKVFQLILCIIVNCKQKEEYIELIMGMEYSTQEILAQMIQNSLEKRLCTLEVQRENQIIYQLQEKQQENITLYEEIQKLKNANFELEVKLNQYEKMSELIEYEKQKIVTFNKKNGLMNQKLLNSCSFIDKSNYDDSNYLWNNGNKEESLEDNILLQSSFNLVNQSLNPGNNNTTINNNQHIIQSLKNKIIRLEQTHSQQLDQMEQKMFQMEQKLKETYHYQELLLIYQQKYQQALLYVQKVSQYQKQKNKIHQQMIQKDLIIQELKENIQQLNQNLVQIEQQKIDLQLLIAKKNNQKIKRTSYRQYLSKKQPNKNVPQLPSQNMLDGGLLLRKTQTYKYSKQQQIRYNHHRQTSAQIQAPKSNKKQQYNIYPYLQAQQQQQYSTKIKIQQLQIKLQSLTLDIKRLQRKQKQLIKKNQLLKGKLDNTKNVEAENVKLQKIIVELHGRNNQQVELLVNCLYETYNQYDFKFHKLIKNTGYDMNSKTIKCLETKKHLQLNNQNQKFKQITNDPKINANQLVNQQKKNSINLFQGISEFRRKSKRNTSLRLLESNQIIEVPSQNQFSKINL